MWPYTCFTQGPGQARAGHTNSKLLGRVIKVNCLHQISHLVSKRLNRALGLQEFLRIPFGFFFFWIPQMLSPLDFTIAQEKCSSTEIRILWESYCPKVKFRRIGFMNSYCLNMEFEFLRDNSGHCCLEILQTALYWILRNYVNICVERILKRCWVRI